MLWRFWLLPYCIYKLDTGCISIGIAYGESIGLYSAGIACFIAVKLRKVLRVNCGIQQHRIWPAIDVAGYFKIFQQAIRTGFRGIDIMCEDSIVRY